MITVDKINIELDFDVRYQEKYYGIYQKAKYKTVVIFPKLEVEVIPDTKTDRLLCSKIMNLNSTPKDCKFNIRDNNCAFFNCSISYVKQPDNTLVFYGITPDYFAFGENADKQLSYCGTWKIPVDYNGDYLEYIKEHNPKQI